MDIWNQDQKRGGWREGTGGKHAEEIKHLRAHARQMEPVHPLFNVVRGPRKPVADVLEVQGVRGGGQADEQEEGGKQEKERQGVVGTGPAGRCPPPLQRRHRGGQVDAVPVYP